MASLLEKLRGLFSSSTPAVSEKNALPSYIRNEDPETCWLTSDLIGDGAYGKIYKVYFWDIICWGSSEESHLVTSPCFRLSPMTFSFFTCVSYAEARNRYRLDIRPSVCLSVCPSHAGTLSKRLNILSCFLHHTIAHSF